MTIFANRPRIHRETNEKFESWQRVGRSRNQFEQIVDETSVDESVLGRQKLDRRRDHFVDFFGRQDLDQHNLSRQVLGLGESQRVGPILAPVRDEGLEVGIQGSHPLWRKYQIDR